MQSHQLPSECDSVFILFILCLTSLMFVVPIDNSTAPNMLQRILSVCVCAVTETVGFLF